MEEVVKALLDANLKLCDQIARLALDIAEIKNALPRAVYPLMPPEVQKSLHMTDEEQEAKFQLDTGALDITEYEEILKGMEFTNTTIDVM